MSYLHGYGGYHGSGGGASSIQSLLTQLQSVSDPSSDSFDPEMRAHAALEYVSQISERLSFVQNEDELSGVRVADLCRTLVSLLAEQGDSPDLMLMSARAMCNLMEALPGASSILVDSPGCVDQLLEKLMNISYIDVAEQSVLALQKISRFRAPSILKAGGLAALLTFVDFFPASVQRVCMQTAAQLLLRVPTDCMELVLQSLPLVLQKVETRQGLDETIHTAIILYFVRVTHAVTSGASAAAAAAASAGYSLHAHSASASASSSSSAPSVSWLTQLERSGMVRTVVDLIRQALKEPSLFSSTALPQLLSVLVSLTRKSSVITEELLDERINILPLIEEIYAQITGGGTGDASAAMTSVFASPSKRASQAAGSASAAAATQQLNPLLSLAMELLPDLRTREPASSAAPGAATTHGASAQQFLEQISRALRTAPAAASSASAAATSSPAAAAAASSRTVNAATTQSTADRVQRQLTFLTPLLDSSSASPDLALESDTMHRMESEEAVALADEDRRIAAQLAAEEGEEEDEQDEEPTASPASAVPSPAASSVDASAVSASVATAKSSLHVSKAQFLLTHPTVLHHYIRVILPLFMHSASSSNDNHVRYKCVSGVLRILCVSSPQSIGESALFPPSPLAALVHSQLHSTESSLVAAAMQLMDLLMQKAEDVFGAQFFREGCVETVQDIAQNGMRRNVEEAETSGNKQAGSTFQRGGSSAAASASSGAPAQQLVQERAKQLLAAHFTDTDGDAELDRDESMMSDDRIASFSRVDAASAVNSPSVSRRRRFSSCATPIFRKAQQLATDLHTHMEEHVQLCQQVHHADVVDAAAVRTLQSSLTSTEDALHACLKSICSCLVGSQFPSAAVAPVSPNSATREADHTADTLTTHEFLHSGLLDSMLAYLFDPNTAAHLTGADASSPACAPAPPPWEPKWSDQQVCEELALQRRQRLFCHVFFGLPRRAVPDEGAETDSPTAAGADRVAASPSPPADGIGDLLVSKLIESLESLDPIRPRTSGVNPAQAMQMMSHPLRVRLIYRPEVPRDDKDNAAEEDEEDHMGTNMRGRAMSMSTSSVDSPVSRRSTRSMTLASSAASPASAAASSSKPTSGSKLSASQSSSPTSTPRKKGFISSAIAAIKRKVSGSSSHAKASGASSADSSPAPAAVPAAAASSAAIAASLAGLYPSRSVHIDPLANFPSIESYLQESISLVDLDVKTERVKAGLPATKTASELHLEAEASAHEERAAARSKRTASNKKKAASKVTAAAAAAAAAAAIIEQQQRDAAAEEKLLSGIRTAHRDAQPIRVMFRFAKKSMQPTPYQSFSAMQHAMRGIGGGGSARSSQPECEVDDGPWIDIGQDRNMSIFEAIQIYHPLGIRYKSTGASDTRAPAAASAAASTASSPRPFSASDMFHTCYDIEFRLTRDPAPTIQEVHTPTKQRPRRGSDVRSALRRVASRSASPHRKLSISEVHDDAKSDLSPVALTESQQAASHLATRLRDAFHCSNKTASMLSSLLLLLDSVHHLAHHWATLYSSWPAIVEFVANNDSIGHGTTGRGVTLPPAIMANGGISSQSHLPYAHSFTSTKLSRQLQLQCEDPIIVLGSALPSWVDTLVRTFPFLFHFSSRELLFRVTAFHPARHLLAIHAHLMHSQPQMMQQAQGRSGVASAGGHTLGGPRGSSSMIDDAAASSEDEEDRFDGPRRGGFGLGGGIGTVEMQNRYRTMSQQHGHDHGNDEGALQPAERIAQLKVRVHRDAVLSAAKQLFLTHTATRRGAIRAEFHGEEAVGIGPTLEFFTLVSQQLQLKSLRLWNKDAPSLTAQLAAESVPMDDAAAAGVPSSSSSAASDVIAMDLDDGAATSAESSANGTPVEDASSRKHTKRKRRSSDAHTTAAAAHSSPKLEGESKRAKGATPTNADVSALALRGSSSPPHLHNATPARLAEFFDICVLQCPTCTVLEVPFCEQHQQFLTVRDATGNWHCAGFADEDASTHAKEEAEANATKKKRTSSRKKKGGKGEEESFRHTPPVSEPPAAAASSMPRVPCFTSTNSLTSTCPHCVRLASTGGLTTSPAAASEQQAAPRRLLKQWRLHAEEVDYVIDSYPKSSSCLSHIVLQCPTCWCINFPGYRASSYGLLDDGHGMLTVNKGGHMVTASNAVVQEKSYRTVTRHVTHTCDGMQLNLVPTILTQRDVIDVLIKCRERTPRLTKKKREKSLGVATSSAATTDSAHESEVKQSAAVAPSVANVPAEAERKSSDEEKEPTSITRVQPSTPTTHSSSLITRTDSAPQLNRTVSASTTVPATSAFEEPTSLFVTSSALYPPPTVQRLSNDPTRVAGVATAAIEWNWLVGRFLGQALMEQRLLDLPFSQTMLKQLVRNSVCNERHYAAAATYKHGGIDITVPRVDQQRAPAALIAEATAIPPPPPSLLLPMMMDLIEVAPHLAKPLLKLLAISYHRFSPHLYPLPAPLLSVDGASIEDLDFDYTLPGHPEIELIDGGASVTVTNENVHLWLWLVARHLLCEGVITQMHCMQEGLKQVLDAAKLQPFFPHELEELVSGGGSFGSKLVGWDWSVSKLRSAIKFRQGYHPESPAIQFLLTIMSELTPLQQRQFTRFITGSPSLPGGQIAALNPPLTVVKIDIKNDAAKEDATVHARGRSASDAINLSDAAADPPTDAAGAPLSQDAAAAIAAAISSNYVLPSVMTCNHNLKLPNYPTIDIMREKLMLAITEGSTGFTLS